MREALGQPLSDISSTVLNKMVSKEVAMDLKKFKNTAGGVKQTKRSKSKGAEDNEDPAQVRFEDQARGHRSRGRSNEVNRGAVEDAAFHSQVKKLLRDIDTGVAEKISLLQMLVNKCDEADQNI